MIVGVIENKTVNLKPLYAQASFQLVAQKCTTQLVFFHVESAKYSFR